MSHIVQSGQKLRLPMGFWPACCKHCFHLVYTYALRKSLSKALLLYIGSLRKGATTTCGMKGGLSNSTVSTKCPELGQLLYDWFIDSPQMHMAR